jgi:hypothetical protein
MSESRAERGIGRTGRAGKALGTVLSAEQTKLVTEHLRACAALHEATAKVARANLQLIEAGVAPRLINDVVACW